MLKGERLIQRLEKLNDGIARAVPISERNCAGEAAEVIKALLEDKYEERGIPMPLIYLLEDVNPKDFPELEPKKPLLEDEPNDGAFPSSKGIRKKSTKGKKS